MAEMQIGPTGITAKLDVKRSFFLSGSFEFTGELFFRNYFGGAPLDKV